MLKPTVRFLSLSIAFVMMWTLASLTGQSGSSKWVSFVALQTHYAYKLAAGEKRLLSESAGVVIRGSDGSTLTRDLPVYGLPPDMHQGDLRVASDGALYSLDYRLGLARLVRRLPVVGLPQGMAEFLAENSNRPSLGTKTIAGVECLGYSFVPKDGRTGEEWDAPSLNFFPMATKVVDERRGLEFDIVTTTVETNVPVAPELFQIPKGFKVQ